MCPSGFGLSSAGRSASVSRIAGRRLDNSAGHLNRRGGSEVSAERPSEREPGTSAEQTGMSDPEGRSPQPLTHEGRARYRAWLAFDSPDEFADPRRAYRRLFSEVLGTFLLVLVAAGGGLLYGKGQVSLAAAVVAPGLMVLAIILFMGAVSGAHLNPVVSLAFALRGDFPWPRVPWYVLAQLLGATLAGLFPLGVFGHVEHLGATLPGPGYRAWQAF